MIRIVIMMTIFSMHCAFCADQFEAIITSHSYIQKFEIFENSIKQTINGRKVKESKIKGNKYESFLSDFKKLPIYKNLSPSNCLEVIEIKKNAELETIYCLNNENAVSQKFSDFIFNLSLNI